MPRSLGKEHKMKNDVEFKYAGGGFDISYDPYTSSFGRPFQQEIRINCFSSGSKTFVKAPDIRNWEERDCFYRERQDAQMNAFLTERFAEIAQKVDALILSEMQKLGFTPEQH